jgi:hypothetical protein
MKKLLLLFTLAASIAFSQLQIDTVYPICIGGPAVMLKANQTGGIWTGQGITNQNQDIFDPVVAGVGSHPIYYTLGNESDTMTILVLPLVPSESSTLYTNSNNTADVTGEVNGGNYQNYDWYDENGLLTDLNILFHAPIGQYICYLKPEFGCSLPDTIDVVTSVVGNDLELATLCIGIARPGFKHTTSQNIYNTGSTTLANCTAEITFDNTKENIDFNSYGSYNINGYSLNGNTISIPLPTINSGDKYRISLAFDVNPDVSLLGTKLEYHTQLSCPLQEVNLLNNVSDAATIIRGSYDPNFVASNYGDGAIADSTSYIKYDVGFQNTGTDTAFNIRVTNFIDTNIFDLSTIKILGSTHNYYMGADNNGLITWYFNNILLPDSFVNEPASHGQIQFIIQLKKGLTVGTTLKDSANIYFDFNPAVITNTAYNTLTNKNGVFELNKKDGSLTIYPNPTKDDATVVIHNFNGKGNVVVSFVDITGKEVLSPIVNNNFNQTTSIQFSTENLSNGLYFVEVTSENKTQSIQLIVLH